VPSIEILREVQELYHVSDRLESLAEQHPLFSETLITISGSVRNTATLLEVGSAGRNENSAALRTGSSNGLISSSLLLNSAFGLPRGSSSWRMTFRSEPAFQTEQF
jgi:hypothetical protein